MFLENAYDAGDFVLAKLMSPMVDLNLLRESKAWPVVEALKVVERVEKTPPEKGFVLFETGYGPSGLPHIGTFGEVFRTSLVRQVFDLLSDIPSRLYAFSDDMDGLRKVPDNVPNPEMVAEHLGKPLTAIPDPYGTHPSFGDHMNGRLKSSSWMGSASSMNIKVRPSFINPVPSIDGIRRVAGALRSRSSRWCCRFSARNGGKPTAPSSLYVPETGVVLQVPILGGRSLTLEPSLMKIERG